MPNRYIREAAIESESVNALSWQAEVFYRRLLNRVDDFGRFPAHSAILRARIFPLQLDKVRDSDIPRLLAECEKSGLVYVYAANGKQFLVMNKWENGRAKKSLHPPPPENICEHMKTYVYGCLQMSPTPTPTPTPTPIPTPIPTTKRRVAPAASPMLLPYPSEEFRSAWALFERHRREIRKPMTPTAAAMALKHLGGIGEKRALRALEHTISKGWQGLREPDQQNPAIGQESTFKRPSSEPMGWKPFLNHEFPDSVFSDGGVRQASQWSDLDADTQRWLVAQMMRKAV